MQGGGNADLLDWLLVRVPPAPTRGRETETAACWALPSQFLLTDYLPMAGRQAGRWAAHRPDQLLWESGCEWGQVQGTRCAASPTSGCTYTCRFLGPAGDGLCRGVYLIATFWSVEAGRGEVLVVVGK